ncbi:hemerythrin-like metal-binding protein [Desulfobulbus propionicus DSM 2032]|jgi:hemerythrin-like metal-binding protein|uniref:Hemerythrin-like metal-binding protein n=1 Tax=Desulfobulbus propionicus (strain ATCC 33891 / DSM 2032 / VKM B-1956 / 1pr3) TaxID=577650 RepID=A0A7U3YLP4_DESPD|nr:hemerythrin domain-containing protein [Desulfobulbus propionicus]ADW17691.1 hemerythrin-like metal-binding protein [Desulfobulbus propionicus DSM 2032]
MKHKKEWDDTLNVGIGLIDNQHKIIFDLINDLGNASASHADKKVIDTLFDVIENYIFRHFEAEEKLIEHHELAAQHTLDHYALIKEFHKFRLSFRNRNNGGNAIHDVLDAWFIDHISRADIPLFASIAKGGSEQQQKIAIDEYPFEQKDRRRHKRIHQRKITDHAILATCYNTTTLKNKSATIVDISLGGLRLESSELYSIDDLLIVTCTIGRNFKMKEKVRVVNGQDNLYGAEFINLSPATEQFLIELYGSVHIRNF